MVDWEMEIFRVMFEYYRGVEMVEGIADVKRLMVENL